MEINDLMEKASRFHGHICPGLAIGVLAAKYLLDNGFKYSPNEEVVAVVENDNCSVDAIQSLMGCTYGKGNLIHQDYGKLNYNFYNEHFHCCQFPYKSNLDPGCPAIKSHHH